MTLFKLCQIELHTSQIDRCLLFYKEVFGWLTVPAEIHNHYVIEVPDECPFGISVISTALPHSESVKNQIILYFEVENAESIVHRAEISGGRRVFGPSHLPAYGTIWHILDPDGNKFGLFEKKVNSVQRAQI